MDDRITEAGRLVAEALTEARENGNPYAEAKLTEDLASVGLIRLEVALVHYRRPSHTRP